MISLPRLVIAAPATGQGKTTIATGLMAALRFAGHEVSGHKVGPDYIDPGYHALASGRAGRNLDPHLVDADRIVPLLLHGAAGADIAIIEGVMGLYDGRLGTNGYASTAHVAQLTRSPIILVVDVSRMSRTAAAVAVGMAAFDKGAEIAGVILNCTGSARNDAEIATALESSGLPVLGMLPRDDDLATPSRHLGLVPAAERDASIALINRLGEHVAKHLDIEALLQAARGAVELDAVPWNPVEEVRPVSSGRPRIAMAGGRAFTFCYTETPELLRAAGCEVVAFDPMSDAALPEGTQGIYLGGGFPETYAADLAANRALIHDLRAAVEAGIPTVAECAGLLYLAQTLDGKPMADLVPATAAMTERLTLRYPVAIAAADSLLTRDGEEVTGHEFHRTQTEPVSGKGVQGSAAAWTIDGAPTGFAGSTWHASYLHIHWAGHPQLAQRFADAAHRTIPHQNQRYEGSATRAESVTSSAHRPPLDPLRHHGDAETGDGLLDFAVNVYPEPRPDWLGRALQDALSEAAVYPDASIAAEAIAQRHGRAIEEVLPTAGAAEAFTLIARSYAWRQPVVVHPQFTEPHAALEHAGHSVTSVLCKLEDDFALDPDAVPREADLVVIGNPTNPTGTLHPAATIKKLLQEGRLVVVDEAFMDTVPGETESLIRERLPGLMVLRSLTKQWSIPGIRAGYAVGDQTVVRSLAEQQTPWSVSTPAIAAAVACCQPAALRESQDRALTVARWRDALQYELDARGYETIPSSTSYILTRLGEGAHAALREQGVAVRRADTFPGLDSSWVRIAVRPPDKTALLCAALDRLR